MCISLTQCVFVYTALKGTGRFQKIRDAVEQGATSPPVDLRFLKELPKEAAGGRARARVASFLEAIYSSVAETLPDHRDESADPGDFFAVYQFEDLSARDPYSNFDSLQRQLSQHSELTRQKSLKPRKKKKSVAINPEKAALALEERYLPPGRMMDYYEQFQSLVKDTDESASFATFWRTWCSDFPHLKFRSTSSHSVCSVCVKHKLLIRAFSGHIAARQKQQELLAKHLREQFLDRAFYWEKRGLSRLGQCGRCGEITLIIDSMDQQKFSYPRAEIYKSKDLSTMVRPRSHVTACLVHGHFLLITVAEHNLPKNANCMTEILAHALTLLRRKGIDTTKLRYRIHSDNTVRECKNNIVLSWLGSMTGRGLIAGGALACLRSGHSHEDIDQCFGNLSFFMARKGRYARHTGDFVVLIRQWLNDLKRPYEKDKYCVKLDELRDWRFDNSLRRFRSSLFSLLEQCEGANVCNILASLFFVVAEMSLDQSYKPGSPNFK